MQMYLGPAEIVDAELDEDYPPSDSQSSYATSGEARGLNRVYLSDCGVESVAVRDSPTNNRRDTFPKDTQQGDCTLRPAPRNNKRSSTASNLYSIDTGTAGYDIPIAIRVSPANRKRTGDSFPIPSDYEYVGGERVGRSDSSRTKTH